MTSFVVNRAAGTLLSRFQPLMPAAYARMIARMLRPFGPRERSASTWFERDASASRLGTKFLPENATSNGSSPGTSSAAIRAGPRSSCRIAPRSSAVTQPAPNATSASVFPVMWATPKPSRTTVTPPRGSSRVRARSFPSPSGAGLK